jgi:hypothetical protein
MVSRSPPHGRPLTFRHPVHYLHQCSRPPSAPWPRVPDSAPSPARGTVHHEGAYAIRGRAAVSWAGVGATGPKERRGNYAGEADEP